MAAGEENVGTLRMDVFGGVGGLLGGESGREAGEVAYDAGSLIYNAALYGYGLKNGMSGLRNADLKRSVGGSIGSLNETMSAGDNNIIRVDNGE